LERCSCPPTATKLLRQVPSIGPIRAALLIALIQLAHALREDSSHAHVQALVDQVRGAGEADVADI
jgi:hypothetical protein